MILGRIASEQARAGDTAGARVTFAHALTIAGKIPNAFLRFSTLASVAVAQAGSGSTTLAQATADAIAIAPGEAARIDVEMRLARTLGDVWSRDRTLTDVAVTQARSGDIVGAMQSVAQITRIHRNLAIVRVIEARAESGDFLGAVDAAKSIVTAANRAAALASIASVLVGKCLRPRKEL